MRQNRLTSPALAAQMRRLSNLGHWIGGALLGLVGLLALLEALGVLSRGWIYLWPGLLVVAGVFLPLFIFGHSHEEVTAADHRAAIFQDAQQRQHLIMAGIFLIAGLSELAAKATGVSALSYVWPLGLVVIGIMFLLHTQHGASEASRQAVRIHRILGGTIILAALARGVQSALGDMRGVWAYLWIVLLLIVAVQLLAYREPAGIYTSEEHGGH